MRSASRPTRRRRSRGSSRRGRGSRCSRRCWGRRRTRSTRRRSRRAGRSSTPSPRPRRCRRRASRPRQARRPQRALPSRPPHPTRPPQARSLRFPAGRTPPTRTLHRSRRPRRRGSPPLPGSRAQTCSAATTTTRTTRTTRTIWTITELQGDAALQGAHEAAHAAGGTIVSSLQGVTEQLPDSYWSTWEPGFGAAAAKDAAGGLKELLDQADITLKGLTDSAVDRIGNALADGLARGDSFEVTAKAVQEVVASPQRAALIAGTEYGRAMSAAAMDTYDESGVEQVDWLAEDSACEQCAANASGSPYALADAPTQPAHPACRCAVAPHV
ncbi:MAG: phage minor head protein [Solirubrobacteraceae bacterium]